MSTRMKCLTLVVVGILALSISLFDHAPSAKASIKSETLASRPNPLLPVEERIYKLVERTFPDVIEIVEVKNLQAADFPLSMEIVFKNLTARNVYGLSLNISFPDTNVQGYHLGSLAFYGEERLLYENNKAKPDASFLAPGETGIIKMERDSALAYAKSIETGRLPLAETYKLEIMFQMLDFGDGTGYVLNRPYPPKISELQKGLNKTQRLSDRHWREHLSAIESDTAKGIQQGHPVGYSPQIPFQLGECRKSATQL